MDIGGRSDFYTTFKTISKAYTFTQLLQGNPSEHQHYTKLILHTLDKQLNEFRNYGVYRVAMWFRIKQKVHLSLSNFIANLNSTDSVSRPLHTPSQEESVTCPSTEEDGNRNNNNLAVDGKGILETDKHLTSLPLEEEAAKNTSMSGIIRGGSLSQKNEKRLNDTNEIACAATPDLVSIKENSLSPCKSEWADSLGASNYEQRESGMVPTPPAANFEQDLGKCVDDVNVSEEVEKAAPYCFSSKVQQSPANDEETMAATSIHFTTSTVGPDAKTFHESLIPERASKKESALHIKQERFAPGIAISDTLSSPLSVTDTNTTETTLAAVERKEVSVAEAAATLGMTRAEVVRLARRRLITAVFTIGRQFEGALRRVCDFAEEQVGEGE